MGYQSQFHEIGIGVVAEHKAIGAVEILVTLPEQTPVMDGVIKSNPTMVQASGTDADGKAYQTAVMTDTTVTATWLPESGNRASAPDVRRLERVRVYQYADQDKYYWKEYGLDSKLRRQETVTTKYNNNPDPTSADTSDVNNCYYSEVSTHNGTVTLSTNKSNGEPVAWTVQINAKAGVLNVVTDNGHEFSLDAVNMQMLAQLSTGTLIELIKNVLNMKAPDAINLEAVNTINMKTKQINMTASQGIKMDSPLVEVTGILKAGAIETVTTSGQAGTATIASDVTITQSLTVKQTLTAEHIVTPTDIDAPNV